MRIALLIALKSILLFSLVSCNKPTSADLVITNANIWTGNQKQPFAQALAVKGDTILSIGTDEHISKYITDQTEKIDANGNFVTPGFIDSHVHFLTGGFNLSSVQLRDAQTPEEFADRIKEFAATQKPGTWILGGDWNHENWGGDLPTKEWIDQYTHDHPVWVTRLDGHMSLANSAALKAAGIDNTVKDVAGGTIVRDKKGNITGVFKDRATDLIDVKVPPPTDQQVDNALQSCHALCSRSRRNQCTPHGWIHGCLGACTR